MLDTSAVSGAEGDQIVRADYYSAWTCPDVSPEEVNYGDSPDTGTADYTVFSAIPSEIGFSGDHVLTKYEDEEEIDSPDGTEPVWKAEEDPALLVCYTRKTKPVLFGTFEVKPSLSAGESIEIVAYRKDTDSELARATSYASDNSATFSDFEINEELEDAVKQVSQSYDYKVETSENETIFSGSPGLQGITKFCWSKVPRAPRT